MAALQEQKEITDEELLRIWKATTRNRAFELLIAGAHKEKKLAPAPIYLSIGTEHVAASVFVALHPFRDKNVWDLFPQHRCHSWFLSFGGEPRRLVGELTGVPNAFASGMCGSASLHGDRIYGHSGLLGDQVPIAAGKAFASGSHTVVVMGDAAAEEDYVLSTLGFVASKAPPLLMIVEDNDLSILTKKEVRRDWNIVKVAKSFGLDAHDISDDPVTIFNTLKGLTTLPALVNIRVCRHYWHAGSGQDGPPQWDTYRTFKEMLVTRFGAEFIVAIESASVDMVKEIWEAK